MNYLTSAACGVVALLLMLSFNFSAVIGEAVAQRRKAVDYSKFSHSTHVNKEKPACDSCHTFPSKNWKEARKSEPFPDVTEFPEHQACLSCHRQQFFARERPAPKICSNCHVKATPNDTARHLFPTLREKRDFVSDFQVKVPQENHDDLARPLNHGLCFSCHNQETELAPLPPNCDACHKRQ